MRSLLSFTIYNKAGLMTWHVPIDEAHVKIMRSRLTTSDRAAFDEYRARLEHYLDADRRVKLEYLDYP